MRKLLVFTVAAILMAVGFLVACAPATAPAPLPAAPAPAAQPAPALTPEETAWAQVVAAAKKEGRLTLYNYSFVGDLGLALQRAFEKRYGIKVDLIAGRGAEFLERLKVEQRMDRMVADLVEGNPAHIRNMQMLGITALLDLPILRQQDVWALPPAALDPQGHFLSYTMYFWVPMVNTRLVKPAEEPKSMLELLEPRWKGKKIVEKDPEVSTGLYNLLPFIRHKMIPPDYVERLAKQDLYLVRSTFDEVSAVARGDAQVSVKTTPVHASTAVMTGAPLKALEMHEGHMVSMLAISGLNNAPRPNAAKVFMNWLFSEEGQLVHGKSAGATSVRKGVPDFLPEPLQVKPKKFFVLTVEDSEAVSKAFREKIYVKYFK